MSITDWGPATWRLFHVLAECLHAGNYPDIGQSLVQLIVYICSNLPCPECTQHAMKFWNKQLQIRPVQSASDLRNILFVFHNSVNARKRKPTFPFDDISKYKGMNIARCFRAFSTHFLARGNLDRVNDTFRRSECIKRVHAWLTTHFTQLTMAPPPPHTALIDSSKKTPHDANK